MQNGPVKLLDVVALLEERPQDDLVSGQVGTVVEVHSTDGFEVEFLDSQGGTIALVTLQRADFLGCVTNPWPPVLEPESPRHPRRQQMKAQASISSLSGGRRPTACMWAIARTFSRGAASAMAQPRRKPAGRFARCCWKRWRNWCRPERNRPRPARARCVRRSRCRPCRTSSPRPGAAR